MQHFVGEYLAGLTGKRTVRLASKSSKLQRDVPKSRAWVNCNSYQRPQRSPVTLIVPSKDDLRLLSGVLQDHNLFDDLFVERSPACSACHADDQKKGRELL